ncbi:hypothetical protein [Streptomyces sp. NBC_01446]|uniref:hypothetical protein n=1 Tax=Streptomyces sp. NBC_01446 TaxID=2903870 RepID=UPI00224EC5ED|nr:hypothetical protein [Streptomyces sp. NBC_01446]MCX4649466.1 hypothetical protein [Streptomyces sp. NBC_01446]
MADRQTVQLFDHMRRGMPFEFTTKMSMMKRLATLVSTAELFGYQYAGARQEIFSIKLLFTPDPSPQAQARAAQCWPYAPQMPGIPPQTLELNKKRVLFDLSSKAALLKRLPVVGVIVLLAFLRSLTFLGSSPGLALGYGCGMAVLAGVGIWINFLRHKKAGAYLQAAGFVRHEPAPGQVFHLPPGSQPQHGQSLQQYAQQAPGYGGQAQPPHGAPQQQPPQYGQQQPPQYGQQQPPQYGQQQPPQYGQQQPPQYGQQQPPQYGQQAPYSGWPPQ